MKRTLVVLAVLASSHVHAVGLPQAVPVMDAPGLWVLGVGVIIAGSVGIVRLRKK